MKTKTMKTKTMKTINLRSGGFVQYIQRAKNPLHPLRNRALAITGQEMPSPDSEIAPNTVKIVPTAAQRYAYLELLRALCPLTGSLVRDHRSELRGLPDMPVRSVEEGGAA